MKEIKFNTKFDLGQDVAYLSINAKKIKEAKVERISYDIYKKKVELWYFMNNGDIVKEEYIYISREELIASL